MEKVRQLGRGLVTAAVGLAVLVWFLTAVAHLDTGRRDEGRQQLEDAIRRSAVACYAAEGVYPPDVAYLEAHYGVRVDWDHYTVDYQVFASNLMPDITVLRSGTE